MPLAKGYSQRAFRSNLRRLRREKKPMKQALAISFSIARREAAKHGVRPRWLERRRSRHRRQRVRHAKTR